MFRVKSLGFRVKNVKNICFLQENIGFWWKTYVLLNWSWFEASCLTNPLRNLHLRLNMVWIILLYKSFKKGFTWSWSWFEASCFTDPLRKASFEAGSGLELLPLQILGEKLHLRLELVWSHFLYKSLKKGFIWCWSWFEASCFTNPLRKSSFEAGFGLKHFALQLL